MEQWAIELIKQAPSTAAIIIVVSIFIKYMITRDAAHGELMREIKTSCHTFMLDVNKESTGALTRNSVALDRNSEALGAVSVHISKNSNRGNQ